MEKPLALTREELDRIAEAIAKTGNDRLMVGFNRRFAPLLDHDEARASARPRPASVDPLPGQRRPAGRGQLVPQRGGGGVAVHRRGRPLHRHAELVGGQPARGGLRRARARSRTTCRPPSGSPTAPAATISLRHRRQRALPEGDAGRRRRRPQRAARQLQEGHGLDRAAARPPRGRAAARTRASEPRWRRSSRPCRPARPMPIALDSLVATTRATIAVRREPAEREAGAGVSAPAAPRLGWYARRVGQDVACRGGLARPRPGAPGGLVAAAGAAGSSSRRGRAPPAAASAGSPPCLPPGTAARVPEEARAAVARGRGPAAARASGRSWASSGPTWCSPTGSATR